MIPSFNDFVSFMNNPEYELFIAFVFLFGFCFCFILDKLTDYLIKLIERKYKAKLTKEIKAELGVDTNEDK